MDAPLRLKLPASLPLVRIEDGSVAAQMQDYSYYPVGVLGFGELGRKIAERARDLGFPVAGWSCTPKAFDGIQSFSGDSLQEFLSRSRVLICALPLTAQTKDIQSEQHLSLL
jgi:glyoxylate/hydroxypyruvate reductase